jgi:hypothetical protein
MDTVKKFETGKKYFCRSICDHNCIWSFVIVKRTEKSIYFSEIGSAGVSRKSLRVWNGVECFSPMGVYSMSPIVTAEKEVA